MSAHANLLDHVRNTFSGVLSRSPEVKCRVLGSEYPMCAGDLHIELRGDHYLLMVSSFKPKRKHAKMNVVVYRCSEPKHLENGQPHEMALAMDTTFFKYFCAANQLGPLKRQALILLKKMEMREIHEVMET